MNIRGADTINTDLGEFALPEGFQQVPIFGYMDPVPLVEYNDDLNIYGCPYSQVVDEDRFPADSTYTDYWWVVDDLTEPLQACFNLDTSKSLSFMDVYNKCDIIISRKF